MADLRPMELGEILDASLTIYRRHLGLLLQLGVAALWLPVSLTIYIQLAGGEQQHLVLFIATGVIQYFAGLFLTAGAIRVISDSYLGRPPQLRDALALGVSKIWPLFVVGFGKALVLGLLAGIAGLAAAAFILPSVAAGAKAVGVIGVFALLVLGLWFTIFVACGYGVTTQVVVLEELSSAFDAFGRSWELTRTFKRKIFALAVVAFIIFFVPVLVVSGLNAYFTLRAPSVGQAFSVLVALLPIVMTPLLACVFTLMYYDLRVRREAFDLELLGRQLGIV